MIAENREQVERFDYADFMKSLTTYLRNNTDARTLANDTNYSAMFERLQLHTQDVAMEHGVKLSRDDIDYLCKNAMDTFIANQENKPKVEKRGQPRKF